MKKAGPIHAGPVRVAGARVMLLLTTSFLFAGAVVFGLRMVGFDAFA